MTPQLRGRQLDCIQARLGSGRPRGAVGCVRVTDDGASGNIADSDDKDDFDVRTYPCTQPQVCLPDSKFSVTATFGAFVMGR